MALEMEFDERALKKNSQDYRADRLRDYLRAFDSYGIIKSFLQLIIKVTAWCIP